MRKFVYAMFITNNSASFHSWWNENLAKYQKVSQYYENDYSFVISLFFHICFCFESLAVLFRVMNSEILTIFKMLLFNEITDFFTHVSKISPRKSLQIKWSQTTEKEYKIKSVLRLQSTWNYWAYDIIGRITSESKTLQLQNFMPRHFLC